MAIGAATLADMFEPAERGTKVGFKASMFSQESEYLILRRWVYTTWRLSLVPLALRHSSNIPHSYGKQAIGPIFGGALTTGFNWRAIFWFLSIVSGSSFLAFLLFFRDTFRRERSLTYQNAMRQRTRISSTGSPTPLNVTYTNHSLPCIGEKKTTTVQEQSFKKESDVQTVSEVLPIAKLSLMDVNPFKPILLVVSRVNNFVILMASGTYIIISFTHPLFSIILVQVSRTHLAFLSRIHPHGV